MLDTFPESGARNQLCFALRALGRHEQALSIGREAIRFNRNESFPVANTAFSYLYLNRPLEAQAILDEARFHNPNEILPDVAYAVAFVRHDRFAMQQYLTWAMGKAGDENALLSQQASAETYYGHLGKARELWQRAVESASRDGALETAAGWRASEALGEAEFGYPARARKLGSESLALSHGPNVEALAALVFARAGDTVQAKRLAEKLNRDFPRDTLIQSYDLPVIRASIEIQKGHPRNAVEILKATAEYDLAVPALLPNVFSPYVRGQAYAQAKQWQLGAFEFQTVLDHPGLVNYSLNGATARLLLGRAQAMMGDKAAARKSYQDFLTLWKDADPDIPIYKRAIAEYARLQ